MMTELLGGYSLEPGSPRNQLGLRFTAKGSAFNNDIQVQTLTSGPLGHEADEIRVGCRLEFPEGTGKLTITAADPNVQPQLDYRYLTDPRDREKLRGAVRLCVELTESSAYQDYPLTRISPDDDDLASDDALDQWLRTNVLTQHHSSGTCKMGPDSDPLAVVDQRCRVREIEGLRVVDASVMPDVVRSNTNATTIMIAERVADWF